VKLLHAVAAREMMVESEAIARERDGDGKIPWWRTLPAMLTAAATFIGSVAAVLALFIVPGGGGGGSNGGAARGPPASTPTATEEPAVPLRNKLATDKSAKAGGDGPDVDAEPL
jgi:hypothetical protein